MATRISFEEEFRKLVNSYSMESASNTPDFILSRYLIACMDNFNHAVRTRDEWYKFKPFDNFPEEAKKIKL
jgi:hypothetical protein